MLVAVGSVKDSPLATTVAVGLVARCPQPGAVMVEADPAGGVLALRFGHHRQPGLTELAAAARRPGRFDLDPVVQRLRIGADVVFAPAAGEAAEGVTLLAEHGLARLRELAAGRLLAVDVGRLDPRSPALPIAAAADLLLLVCRAWPDALDAVAARRNSLPTVQAMPAPLRLVITGIGPHPRSQTAAQAARATGLTVAAVLPPDRRGEAVLAGRMRPGWAWTRLDLPRALRGLALTLQDDTAPAPAVHSGPAAVLGVDAKVGTV
jgi:hypothetical protein